MQDLEARATQAIEDEEEMCFDVAANVGQMFGNVKHMQWFRRALMLDICESDASYSHLRDALPA
ncbi:hypothetical protein F6X40_09355 [Paraburkholderia sp. UCT31]|nr:hypothetical protein [Paraburkholderia sp. UCT31]